MSGDGKWKLHLPHEYRTLEVAGRDGLAGKYSRLKIDTALFDMEQDPYETTNVIEQFPDVAIQLIDVAEKHKAEFYTAE